MGALEALSEWLQHRWRGSRLLPWHTRHKRIPQALQSL
jgi:hypothetical protein